MRFDLIGLAFAGCLVLLAPGCGPDVVGDGATSSGSGGSLGATSGVPAASGAMSTGAMSTGAMSTGAGGPSATSSTSGSGGGELWEIFGLYGTAPHGDGFGEPFIAVDDDGDTYFTVAYSGGPITFSAVEPCVGTSNLLLAKVSPAGQLLWSRCLAATPHGSHPNACFVDVSGIAVSAAGRLLVVGSFSGKLDYGAGELETSANTDSQAFLMSLDADSGDDLWAQQFAVQVPGDPGWGLDFGWGVATDDDGNAYLGGFVDVPLDLGAVSFQPNGQGLFLAKLDPLGQGVWVTEVGHEDYPWQPEGAAVAASRDGTQCAISSYLEGTADFAPGTTSMGNGVFAVADALTGAIEWGLFPPGMDTWGVTAVFDGGDNLVLGGGSDGSLDLGAGPVCPDPGCSLVAKLDPSGAVLWEKSIVGLPEGSGYLAVDMVAVDPSGEVLYAAEGDYKLIWIDGHAIDCPHYFTGECLFFGGIDAGGTVGAAEVVTSYFVTYPSVAFGPGEWLVAGQFEGRIDFGSGKQPAPVHASNAVFLAALPPAQ